MLGSGRSDLAEVARKEWDESLAAANAICEEVLDLSFRGLALGKEPPAYDTRCPFPGLLAFGSRFATSRNPEDDDRRYFFGREGLVQELADKLHTHPFLAVLGGSGSGKSSLVLAGLVPALASEKRYHDLRMVYMTPGSDPLARLEAALGAGIRVRQHADGDDSPPSGADQPSSILIVDQFEELFRLTQDINTRRSFIQRMLEMPKQYLIVLTMRADFWGRLRTLSSAEGGNARPPGAHSAHDLRRAAQRHGAAGCFSWSPVRSGSKQYDLGRGRGRTRSYASTPTPAAGDVETPTRPWLRASEYRALGGIRQAIAHTADGIYTALSRRAGDHA